jgi:hypothetical protein
MVIQLITLLGVVVGVASTFLANTAMDRRRYRRDLDDRWTERKLAAYAAYLGDVKKMRVIARRILHDSVPDVNLPIPLAKDEGLPLLAEAEAQRSVSAELVILVGSEAVVNALRALNEAVWKIEWFARDLVDNADGAAWQQASVDYAEAINAFQEAARRDVRTPGGHVPRGTLP